MYGDASGGLRKPFAYFLYLCPYIKGPDNAQLLAFSHQDGRPSSVFILRSEILDASLALVREKSTHCEVNDVAPYCNNGSIIDAGIMLGLCLRMLTRGVSISPGGASMEDTQYLRKHVSSHSMKVSQSCQFLDTYS